MCFQSVPLIFLSSVFKFYSCCAVIVPVTLNKSGDFSLSQFVGNISGTVSTQVEKIHNMPNHVNEEFLHII